MVTRTVSDLLDREKRKQGLPTPPGYELKVCPKCSPSGKAATYHTEDGRCARCGHGKLHNIGIFQRR